MQCPKCYRQFLPRVRCGPAVSGETGVLVQPATTCAETATARRARDRRPGRPLPLLAGPPPTTTRCARRRRNGTLALTLPIRCVYFMTRSRNPCLTLSSGTSLCLSRFTGQEKSRGKNLTFGVSRPLRGRVREVRWILCAVPQLPGGKLGDHLSSYEVHSAQQIEAGRHPPDLVFGEDVPQNVAGFGEADQGRCRGGRESRQRTTHP